jgi:anti-repressor protein
MTDMIKITQNSRLNTQAVDARELWYELESKQEFSNWIKSKVVNNPLFIENEDYCSFDNIVKREKGASVRKDFALTINTAKQVALMENTEKGREIRQYFIDSEKKLQAMNALPNFNNPVEAARAWADEVEAKQALQAVVDLQRKELKESAPKIEYHDKILANKGVYTVTQIAKDFGLTAIRLNQILNELGIQFKSRETWVLYEKYQKMGYTATNTHLYTNEYGQDKKSLLTVWTEQGRRFIYSMLTAYFKKHPINQPVK